MRSSRGQNLVEYILLVTAVLVVGIFFFTKGPMQQAVNSSLYTVVNDINNLNSQIQFQ